ncbi:MAG: RNA polymerase sigma factor, partial [Acidimicrobiales bacterium]
RPPENLVPMPESGQDVATDVFDQVAATIDKEVVARALAHLPEAQRVCLVLMDLAGHTAAETAEILGCPRGTVLARVHRGRRRLAGLLVAEGIQR